MPQGVDMPQRMEVRHFLEAWAVVVALALLVAFSCTT
jgi:hypothetical protein